MSSGSPPVEVLTQRVIFTAIAVWWYRTRHEDEPAADDGEDGDPALDIPAEFDDDGR